MSKLNAQSLDYFYDLEFILINAQKYEEYHEELKNSKASKTQEERCKLVTSKLYIEFGSIDLNNMIDNAWEGEYIQRKIKEDGNRIHNLKSDLFMYSPHNQKKIVSDVYIESNLCQDPIMSGTMDIIYFHYKANITMPDLWFIQPCYCFSYEFLTMMKKEFSYFDDVLRMESKKHLIPVFLGSNTEIESYDSDYPHSDFRLSDKMINYLYKGLINNSDKFEGVLNEDYALFLELLSSAKDKNCYLVLSFIGMGF